MWLPDVMTSTPHVEELLGGGWREAATAGGVLAVGDDEVDVSARDLSFGQHGRDGAAAQLADDVADQEHVERHVPSLTRADRAHGSSMRYFAYSTERRSRMTVTLTWPG